MDTLAINEPGLILDELVSSCDDNAWRLRAAAISIGGRAGQQLAALAVRCEEQSLALVSIRVPFVARRFEAMYERASVAPHIDGDRLTVVCGCLERLASLADQYHAAAQQDLPASWAVLVSRHLEELVESCSELKRVVATLPVQPRWAPVQTP